MEKTIVVGYAVASYVKITIQLFDGNLSITGSCKSSSGQNYDEIMELVINNQINYVDGWGAERLTNLCRIWERWHMNDMRPGDAVQMEAIRTGKSEIARIIATKELDWYSATCYYLKSLGLYEHDGYKFGYGWKREELPQEVIDFISAILAE